MSADFKKTLKTGVGNYDHKCLSSIAPAILLEVRGNMPEPAGLYAGVGRSLCQSRPVSMPASAGLYAGVLYKKTDFLKVVFELNNK